jgi:ribosomal protein S20
MKYSKTAGNKREVAIGTAYTVSVNSLNEINKQTNKRLRVGSIAKQEAIRKESRISRNLDKVAGCRRTSPITGNGKIQSIRSVLL